MPSARTLPMWLRVAALSLGAIAVLALLFVATAGDRITMEKGVSFVSATAPAEVVPGGRIKLTFEVHGTQPLPVDYFLFVHLESATPGSSCRIVADRALSPPSTRWGADQTVTPTVEVDVPKSCRPGKLDVFTGLFSAASRLRIVSPETPDNRVHAGAITIVPDNADESPRTVSARSMILGGWWALLGPWVYWGALVFVAAIGAIAIATSPRSSAPPPEETKETNEKRTPEEIAEDEADKRRAWLAALFGPGVLFVLGVLVVLEFIKDDAYISFRYTHNLVTGQGLVFNPGEKLEGFTNFLWVFVLAPFEALGWDLFQVCEVLGTILGIVLFVQATRFSRWLMGDRSDHAAAWASVWLATSSSLVLWSKSGLEQPLAQLLPVAGAFVLWRSREEDEGRRLERNHLLAGVLLGLGCLTRPELHAIAGLVALPLAYDVARTRKISRGAIFYAAAVLAVTIPAHLFRYSYYGTLVPNTFWVKTGSGSQIWKEGLKTLHDMFEFNATGVLFVLAPLAFANKKRLVEKITMAAIVLTFWVYYVKVGVDEMQWHRLYLPALPFVAILAAIGLRNVLDFGVSLRAWSTSGAALAGWVVIWLAGFNNFYFTYKQFSGFNGHGDLAGTFHPDLGKFLVRHERPGGLVAFQDMGSTPYHAPDIAFLDFFGLVDGTVAHARHGYGLHTFIGGDSENAQGKYDAEMREYFFKRNPEWTILTVYPAKQDEKRLAEAFEIDPSERPLRESFGSNNYQFDLWNDPRFHDRYVHVRTWQRSLAYYLSLWRRRDLWDQTPREVVLDAPPPNLGGITAKLEGGLELLGSELTNETIERHEIFVTTWWKLPGPMPPDTTVFVHLVGDRKQTPNDHIPGDSLYPANRWKAGEILEDRTLVQLPVGLPPGMYKVYLGFFRRSTGERLRVTETTSASSEDNRLLIGSVKVKRFTPMIDQLIPPTRVDIMRKNADRILDPKRAPGQ